MKANSNFEWRSVTPDDYINILVKWWEEWEWECPPIHALPKGIIVSKDGVDLYAGFLYDTGTTIGWLEWIISNKNAPIELKKGAKERLIDIISILAKEKGMKTLFSSTTLPTLKNSLVRNGFDLTDEGNYHLIKRL